MNIYLSKKKVYKSTLTDEEIRIRLNILVNHESDPDFIDVYSYVFSGVDTNPNYEGFVGKKRFNFSPVRRTTFSVVYEVNGSIEKEKNGTVLNVKMEVVEILQKLTNILLVIAGIFSLLMVWADKSNFYLPFMFVLVFYVLISVFALLGYSSSGILLEKLLKYES